MKETTSMSKEMNQLENGKKLTPMNAKICLDAGFLMLA